MGTSRRELLGEINRLQGSLVEKSSQINAFRSMLEDVRQKLVVSNNRIRQLNAQLREAKLTTANGIKKIEELEQETRRLREELKSEKKSKSIKELVAKSYFNQLKESRQIVNLKQKELGDVNRVAAEQKNAIENLNERLSASMQSCAKANDILRSQKVNIAKLKKQLDEERKQKEEQEKAATDLKAVVHRALSDAQEEIRRLSDADFRERELQEEINKLQESEREMCLLVETLRSKLEDTRQKLVVSDGNVRQLETQIHEEKLTTANGIKKIEEPAQEVRRLRKEFERKKATREEVWARVYVLELEKRAAMRDLDFERQRLKGAREILLLQRTQLQALDSTTGEIQILFAKQLKAMQRTLEDEENYENTSVGMDGVIGGTSCREKGVRTAATTEGDAGSAEQVLETDCLTNHGEQNIDLNEFGPLDGDTRQFDYDINLEEIEEHAQTPDCEVLHHSQSHNPIDTEKIAEDTEAEGLIKGADLLTYEVDGSWACSRTPSVHGENESRRSRDNNEGCGDALNDSNILVAESWSTPSDAAAAEQNEQQALLLLT